MASHGQLFIGGEWTAGSGGTTFDTVDPATGRQWIRIDPLSSSPRAAMR